jgi:hypothetical protein
MAQILSQHTVFVFALYTGKMLSVGKLSTVNTTVLGLCKLWCNKKNRHTVHRLKDSRRVKGVKIKTESLKSNPNITSQQDRFVMHIFLVSKTIPRDFTKSHPQRPTTLPNNLSNDICPAPVNLDQHSLPEFVAKDQRWLNINSICNFSHLFFFIHLLFIIILLLYWWYTDIYKSAYNIT